MIMSPYCAVGALRKKRPPHISDRLEERVKMSLNTQTPPQTYLHVTLKWLPFVYQTLFL